MFPALKIIHLLHVLSHTHTQKINTDLRLKSDLDTFKSELKVPKGTRVYDIDMVAKKNDIYSKWQKGGYEPWRITL